MARRRKALVERLAPDTYQLRLEVPERQALHALSDELRDLLLGEDREALQRLFPPAYGSDEERNADFEAIMGDQLLAKRFDDLDVFDAVVGSETFDGAQLERWMTALNALRLALGTAIDVTEDDPPFDPTADDAPARAAYLWLNILLSETLEALDG